MKDNKAGLAISSMNKGITRSLGMSIRAWGPVIISLILTKTELTEGMVGVSSSLELMNPQDTWTIHGWSRKVLGENEFLIHPSWAWINPVIS